MHGPSTAVCSGATRVQTDGISSCEMQDMLYSQAADVTYCNQQHPRWWFYNDKAEDFLRSPNSTICTAEHKTAISSSHNIAIDSIRFLQDEMNRIGSLSWQKVRDTRPVLYITSFPSDRRPQRQRPPPISIEGSRVPPVTTAPEKPVLKSMLSQFFNELRPLVPQTWQPWFKCFDELSIDVQLDVLESLPRPLPPMVSPVDQRLCIIVGLDDAYSQGTHDLVTRFLRIVEQLLITDERGKILFMSLAPLNIKSMLKGESSVMNLKKDHQLSFISTPNEGL